MIRRCCNARSMLGQSHSLGFKAIQRQISIVNHSETQGMLTSSQCSVKETIQCLCIVNLDICLLTTLVDRRHAKQSHFCEALHSSIHFLASSFLFLMPSGVLSSA